MPRPGLPRPQVPPCTGPHLGPPGLPAPCPAPRSPPSVASPSCPLSRHVSRQTSPQRPPFVLSSRFQAEQAARSPSCLVHPFEALTGGQRSWPGARRWGWCQSLAATSRPAGSRDRAVPGPTHTGTEMPGCVLGWHGHSSGAAGWAVPTAPSPFSRVPCGAALCAARSLRCP